MKDLALNSNRTGKRVEFFSIPTFIWRPTWRGLLNLAKPAQKLYFFDDFFHNFKESTTEYFFKFFIFFILAKFRPK